MAVDVVRSNLGIIAVLLLIGIALSLLSDVFLTYDNLISVFRQISNNMYLALGMTLVMILGGIDLSVGSIVAMCGTLTVGLMVTNGVPMVLAISLGLLIGTAAGFINGMLVAMFRVPSFIVTLSMMNVAKGIAYVYSGGRSTRIMNSSFNVIGTGYIGFLPLPILYMIIMIVIFSILLNYSKFGTYIFAVGGNRESAHLSGVPIKKVEIIVFTIAGFLAAFAGIILSSRMYSGQPSVGEGYELDAIAACVLGGVSMSGGVGRISGTIFGVMVIGIISNGLNLMNVSSYWQLIVKGFIIMIAVLIDTQKGRQNFVTKLLARKY
ncbi:MAG: ABC transporter permease [Eubacteriales bacterium]|nr:ABC transporter permease [Eubacteriales bacterium]